jgi:hypothetical protein
MIRYLLLILPIHRSSYDKYYADHDKYVINMKAKLNKIYKYYDLSFDKLSEESKARFEERWFYPPWIFNDIIGFLNIGSDYDGRLSGDIYLKRKYFHKESFQRVYMKYYSTLKKNQFLYYSTKMPNYYIDLNNNYSYIKAALKIIEDGNEIVYKFVRGAEIWLPGYDLACLNMAEADKQLRIGENSR